MLVVDDDGSLLESLQLLLSDDCDVTCCDSPQLALEHLAARPVEIVITDLMMPQMSGLEFAAAVKKQSANPPYCLMLTGTPGSVKSADPGASDLVMVMAKPFEPERLLHLVLQIGRLALNRQGKLSAR